MVQENSDHAARRTRLDRLMERKTIEEGFTINIHPSWTAEMISRQMQKCADWGYIDGLRMVGGYLSVKLRPKV